MSETPGPIWLDDIREWVASPNPQKCDRCGKQIRYDRVERNDLCERCREMVDRLKDTDEGNLSRP